MNREKEIRKRFYLCYSMDQLKFLTDNGYVYLFRCYNKKENRFYYVFDKTHEMMELLKSYREEKRRNREKME